MFGTPQYLYPGDEIIIPRKNIIENLYDIGNYHTTKNYYYHTPEPGYTKNSVHEYMKKVDKEIDNYKTWVVELEKKNKQQKEALEKEMAQLRHTSLMRELELKAEIRRAHKTCEELSEKIFDLIDVNEELRKK